MTITQRLALDELLRAHPLDLAAPLEILRPQFEEAMSLTPIASGTAVQPVELGDVLALQVRSENIAKADAGVILYFHGGAFVVGGARGSLGLASEIARRSDATVLSVDYRLAPESPYPAAREDALAAYEALLQHGVAPERIGLFGESAGGNLVASLLLSIKASGLPMPASAVLLSPWTNLALTGRSVVSKAVQDPAITEDALRARAREYAGDALLTDPLVSPSFGDLGGLPPLLIQAGSNEILLDDALEFGAAAAAHEVDVSIQITGGVPHVFPSFFPMLDEGSHALDEIARFFARTLLRSAEHEAR